MQPHEPFKLDNNPTERSKEELCGLVEIDDCREIRSKHALEEIVHREPLIVTFSVCILFHQPVAGVSETVQPCGSGSFCLKEAPCPIVTSDLGK